MSPDAQERFEQLWADHAPAVLRYAHRRVAPADVDDVVADTFVVVWRRLDDVPAAPLPWILRVARGVAANTRRTRTRQAALATRIGDDLAVAAVHVPIPGGAGDLVSPGPGEEEDRVRAALERLSDLDREALTLTVWDGLDRTEAAQVLGCSRAALAVRAHRARRRLAALLPPAALPPPASDLQPAPTARPGQRVPHRGGQGASTTHHVTGGAQ